MNRLSLAIGVISSLGILIPGTVTKAQPADGRGTLGHLCDETTGPRSSTCMVQRRVTVLREVRDTLRKEAAAPMPAEFSPEETGEARRYTAWLITWADRLDALGLRGNSALGKGGQGESEPQSQAFQATKEMQEQQLSFNFQYLQLSKQMESEHRQFNLISNIMKTKFATIEKSINYLVAGR